jgi:transglutaminase-like putative cysteine protease
MNYPVRRCRWLVLLSVLLLLPPVPGRADDEDQAKELSTKAAKLEKERKYPEALAALAEAIPLAPMNDTYPAQAARLAYLLGKDSESLKYAREAAKRNPKAAGHQLLVLRAAVAVRDYDLAKDAGNLVIELGTSQTDKAAVTEAKTTLGKLDGFRADLRFAKACELHRDGKHTEALEEVKQGLTLVPKHKALSQYLPVLEPLVQRDKADQHALQAPKEAEENVEALAKYLVQNCKTERDKARAIYRWITDRIAYDTDAYFNDRRSAEKPEEILSTRKCVCAGYAILFEKLATLAGLEAKVVGGFCKGFGWKPEADVSKSLHGWNVVKIDKQWQLVDATWGAGTIGEERTFVKRYEERFFLTSPEQMIFDHFPEDKQWQLLKEPVTKEAFQKWPKVPRDLFELAVPVQDIRQRIDKDPTSPFVEARHLGGPLMKVLAAPLEGRLKNGQRAKWRVEAQGVEAIAFVINEKWFPMSRKGDVFEGDLLVKKGELAVGAKRIGGDGKYYILLKYVIE